MFMEVPLWPQLALLVVAGCASQCVLCAYMCTIVSVCVYVCTPLEYMPSLPQAGPANGNGSKQTGGEITWAGKSTGLGLP